MALVRIKLYLYPILRGKCRTNGSDDDQTRKNCSSPHYVSARVYMAGQTSYVTQRNAHARRARDTPPFCDDSLPV